MCPSLLTMTTHRHVIMMQTGRIGNAQRHSILVMNTTSVTLVMLLVLRAAIKLGLILVCALEELKAVVNLGPFLETTIRTV